MRYTPERKPTTHRLVLTHEELIQAIETQIATSRLSGNMHGGEVPKIPKDATLEFDVESDDDDAVTGFTVTWLTYEGIARPKKRIKTKTQRKYNDDDEGDE